MDDNNRLRPATSDEIAESIVFALRYQGRKRVSHADEMMRGLPPTGWCGTFAVADLW